MRKITPHTPHTPHTSEKETITIKNTLCLSVLSTCCDYSGDFSISNDRNALVTSWFPLYRQRVPVAVETCAEPALCSGRPYLLY